MMKLIPLTQGLFAQVDDEDYERVSQFKWHARRQGKTSPRFYAVREYRRHSGVRAVQFMHVFIMNTPRHLDTHHIDNDGLNNRRSNLVVVTRAEHKRLDRDQCRRKLNKNSTTLFKGVFLVGRNKYQASISEYGKKTVLGLFATAAEAGRARDAAARKWGWPEPSMNYPHDLRPSPSPLPAEHPSHKTRRNASGYCGVCFSRRDQNWRSYIVQNRRQYWLGGFSTPEKAACARDAKAREFGWPEGVMNFPL